MRLSQLRPSFMRDHRFTMRHAAPYAGGELDAGPAERVHRHTSRCPQCRELVRTLRRTLEGLRGLRDAPAGEPRPDVAEGVIARLRRDA